MDKDDNQLQSLVDPEEQQIYKQAKIQPKLYQPKSKSIDLYESLISTNHQGLFYSQLMPSDQFDIQMSQIDFLSYQQQTKRKRGRPKKGQIKEEEEYRSDQEQQEQFQTRLNKNKKKKQRLMVKGNSRNLFYFFQRLMINYLKKYTIMEQLKQIQQVKNCNNRVNFFKLIKKPQFHSALSKMFQTRYLNRAVVGSRICLQTKLFYLKKVQLFKQAFDRKEVCIPQ